MNKPIPMIHDIPLESFPAETAEEILREGRASPLFHVLLARLRDRAEGSVLEASGRSYEGLPGVDYQLGAAAALREFALECWETAQSGDAEDGKEEE